MVLECKVYSYYSRIECQIGSSDLTFGFSQRLRRILRTQNHNRSTNEKLENDDLLFVFTVSFCFVLDCEIRLVSLSSVLNDVW